MSDTSLSFAQHVVDRCGQLGATESSAAVSRSSHIQIIRRDGQVEQATEATTQSLSITVLVDDCFCSSSTSDLRPDAVEQFVEKSIAAAQYLEPDDARRHADEALCGRGVSQEDLDQDDACWGTRTAEDRSQDAEQLETALQELSDDRAISGSVMVADGRSEVAHVLSNGFSGVNQGAWFAAGGERTIQDGDRRPEAGAHYGARHLADLPAADALAQTIVDRVEERVGAGPIDSGRYPLVLSARAAGRILGILAGPLSGGALHQRRSCLSEHEGKAIGSACFTLTDDPTIPRGLGSRPWDGDALCSRPLTLIDEGVLRNYYVSVYHGRKLDRAPTTGGRSNWVIPAGTTPWQQAAQAWPKAIRVTGFLGGNSNAASGDFSFGISGQLLEHGKPTQSLGEMNVSGNVQTLFHKLVGVGDDPWAWSAVRSPTLLFEDVQFSGL